MATSAVPGVALDAATKVSVASDDPERSDAGDTVTPLGSPRTASATSPVKPPERVSLTETLSALPCETLSEDDESAIEIAGAGVVLPAPPAPPPHPSDTATHAIVARATRDRTRDISSIPEW